MQSTESWVVRYFQKHESVKFSLLLRFVRDMESFDRLYRNFKICAVAHIKSFINLFLYNKPGKREE